MVLRIAGAPGAIALDAAAGRCFVRLFSANIIGPELTGGRTIRMPSEISVVCSERDDHFPDLLVALEIPIGLNGLGKRETAVRSQA